MKVLFVDDKETWHKLFDVVLSLRGIDVVHAKTLKEALNVVSTEKPDVAIVDVTISLSSGYELLPELVKLGVPAIFIGYEKEGFDAEKALSLGALKALRKPFTVDELISTLREVKGKSLPVQPELVVSPLEEPEEKPPEVVTLQPEESEIPTIPVIEEETPKEFPVLQETRKEERTTSATTLKQLPEEKIPVVEVSTEELEKSVPEEAIEKKAVEEVKKKSKGVGISLPEERVEEIIREIAWEVIPEVAEKVIREEVEKLIKSRLA
ncbi:MAG: hypothetical protein DSZ26_02765 [Thermovibrio sp.]|nr:MAG: hypothetical protein DSZ26_02765 [Thermovibrio sp.]